MSIIIIAVTGPIGHGKSTLAAKIAELFKCSNLDSDLLFGKFGFGVGVDRNDMFAGYLREILANGAKTVVISSGGYGINDIKTLITTLTKIEKISLIHCAYAYPPINECDRITKETVLRRIECGTMTCEKNDVNNFLQLMYKKSIANKEIADKIVADITFQWMRENDIILDDLVNVVPANSSSDAIDTYVSQIRIFANVGYVSNTDEKFPRHITCFYGNCKIEKNELNFADVQPTIVVCPVIFATSTANKNHKFEIVLIPEKMEIIQMLQKKYKQLKYPHITQYFPRGICPPSFSHNIVEAYEKREFIVNYTNPKGNVIAFTIDHMPYMRTVEFHGIYAF